MSKRKIKQLEAKFEAARRRGKHRDVLKALEQLVVLDPKEPRWPHQEGETYRRLGDKDKAVAAFERACYAYSGAGFVARAVAMAKMLQQLDPSRTDILERVDPGPARDAHRRLRPAAVSSAAGMRRPSRSLVEQAAVLQPDDSADEDEVRFVEPESEDEVLELDMSEIELIEEASEPVEQLDELAVLPSFPLFAELPRERLARLAAESDLVELPAQTLALCAGEEADALFCIVEGEVLIRVEDLSRHPRLGPGEVFGESALLESARRNADVQVVSPLVALRIPRESLLAAVEGEPRLGDLLFELLARRLVANLVLTSPLFVAFAAAERRQLARRFQLRRAPSDFLLLEEQKRGDALYLLVQGRVTQGRRPRGPGAILGVEALTGGLSSSTVRTRTECVLLRLPRSRFEEVLSAHPEVMSVIEQIDRR